MLGACSSFTASDDPAVVDDGAAPDGDAASSDALVPVDARNIDCGASHCRAVGERYVFATGGALPGNFAADAGAAGAYGAADTFCATEASRDDQHPDLGGRTWHAWLCLETQSAIGRSLPSARWTRPDGTVVFMSTDQLRAGGTTQPISESAGPVWTGCDAKDFGRPSSGSTCATWTLPVNEGAYGAPNATDGNWSSFSAQLCTTTAQLYCLEAE